MQEFDKVLINNIMISYMELLLITHVNLNGRSITPKSG
jgi:hypothetical protein